jgi:hypothetical protein
MGTHIGFQGNKDSSRVMLKAPALGMASDCIEWTSGGHKRCSCSVSFCEYIYLYLLSFAPPKTSK